MPQMHIIEGIIEIALRTASSRCKKEAVALGIVAALRRIHAALYEGGGEAMASAMRSILRGATIDRNLEALRRTGQVPRPVPLPDAEAAERLATAVLEDAASSCLALNALFGSDDPLDLAVRLLARRLMDILGGPPEYAALLDRIADAVVMTAPSALTAPPSGLRPTIN